jgi:hypothetical protein
MSRSVWASRLLALLILILLLGALQLFMGQPLVDSFIETRESIAHSQQILEKYRQLNNSSDQMHGRLGEIQESYDSEGRLLDGGSVQLAGANLQNRLKYLIDANDAELGSMRLLPVREEEGFWRISMAVSFKATTESLQAILYELETQTPYLFVQKLELRKGRNLVNASALALQDADDLKVQLETYGYMLIDNDT